MRRIPIPKNKWQQLILVLVLAAVVIVRLNGWLHPVGEPGRKQSPRSTDTAQTKKPAEQRGNWRTYENCTLSEHRSNDGDSFGLLCDGEKLIVRLYFVDCPEKERYAQVEKRIAEQAAYFGCSEEQVMATGKAAREFTIQHLRSGKITLTTMHEPVYDSDRIYGFVTVDGKDLGETLITQGFARNKTKSMARPGSGITEQAERKRLQELESEAKSRGVGVWRR